MKVFKLSEMKNNWYVGAFRPTAFYTKKFEVTYAKHFKGQEWDFHTHKKATEINLLVRGQMIMQGLKLKKGDIFVIYPNEIADPTFLTDCDIVVIKTPSVKGDKYVV